MGSGTKFLKRRKMMFLQTIGAAVIVLALVQSAVASDTTSNAATSGSSMESNNVTDSESSPSADSSEETKNDSEEARLARRKYQESRKNPPPATSRKLPSRSKPAPKAYQKQYPKIVVPSVQEEKTMRDALAKGKEQNAPYEERAIQKEINRLKYCEKYTRGDAQDMNTRRDEMVSSNCKQSLDKLQENDDTIIDKVLDFA